MLTFWQPPEAERLRIVAGLLELRKDGHFAEIYVDAMILRVRWKADSPIHLMGWKAAARMVGQAKAAAALAAHAYRAGEATDGGRELRKGAQKAQRAGKSRAAGAA